MTATQDNTDMISCTIEARSVSLLITGAPDVPCKYDDGSVRPGQIEFTYVNGRVRARMLGRWRSPEGELTGDPVSQPYSGSLDEWPEWLASLARKYELGAQPSVDRAAGRGIVKPPKR